MTETVNIHGKEYETVASRLHRFRETYPISSGYGISTSIIHHDEERVITRTEIKSQDGTVLAADIAEEWRDSSKINRTSALENCATSSIGRALASAGYLGTEYCSADELTNALIQQSSPPPRVEKTSTKNETHNPLDIPESWPTKAKVDFFDLFTHGNTPLNFGVSTLYPFIPVSRSGR